MTFAIKDASVSSGAPIECYEFIGSFNTWRYTSYHSEITVAGQLYLPRPITRTTIEIGSIIDTPMTMDFSIPSDDELAQAYCYSVSPRDLRVIVRRVHEGDDYSTEYRQEWDGEISGAQPQGRWGVIQTVSKVQSLLNGNTASVYYQRSCNHILYDIRCKAVRADHLATATITKVRAQLISVDEDGYPNADLVGGEMVNLRTGEKQTIITNEDNELRVSFPFYDIKIGDSVELVQGCDHLRLGDCKTRFNNVPNYGGFDHIPRNNPFEKLAFDTKTATQTKIDKQYDQSVGMWTVSTR